MLRNLRSTCSRTVAVLALATCAFVATPAAAEQDALVRDATLLHASGEPEKAYQMLSPHAASRIGDPDFDYALAIAAIDSKRPGEAIMALQRVLALQPGNAPARAELARAYAMTGDIDTAKQQFDTVLEDPTLPDPVRQRFTGIVRKYGRDIRGGGSSISGFADISGGWDSNINSATELTSIVIPLFAGLGPGTLGGAARAIDDSFIDAQAGLSGVTAIGRQDRLFGSVLGGWRENLSDDMFDQQSLTGTAGYAHSFADRDVVSISLQAQQFWLGGSSFRQGYGAIAQYTHLIGGDALSISGQYYRFDYDRDALRDADRVAAAVSYAARRWVVTVNAGKEATRRAAGDANSHFFAGANLGAELPINDRLAFVGGLAFDLRRHDAADVLFLAKRKDERVDASLGLKLLVFDDIYLRPRVTYTRNWSNIGLYDFDRWTAGLGARVEF
ncbi:porin family protein [Sphingomonas colocasiae]|uniref:Tetratricopeptide repeat protein n=1 Tax=Sphingomonas colocasiae TaxID=1848973 RepID=A0ABS7PN00_9SPHN|nr:porin family protein [Sphingomonas colocasiae]MBY8822643.1 tetratricopeptide repeat protein [Sphingomonas colocasiae]